MVKTNKKSLIAMIAMVVLLIASIAMGITGAWFTDKLDDKSSTLNFGKIDIEYSTEYSCTLDGQKVMPGDTLKFSGVITNKEEEAWVALQVAFTGVKGVTNVDKVTKLAKSGTIDLSTELTDIVLTGESYDNTYQGQTITVTVKVCAVQAKNITEAPVDYAAVAAYAA